MTSSAASLVLGAGVSGLSTGILLLEAGFKVHIWAKDLPPYTTSNIAAAVWYPVFCNPKERASAWGGKTLKYLQEHCLSDAESGCVRRTVTEIFDKKVPEPWWKNAVDTYRRPSRDELPSGYIDGYQTETILMDSSKYMDWLMNRYRGLGGTVLQKEICHIDEAFAEYDLVVNCTGLGSRELFHDKEMFPIRGQVVVVKPNGFTQVIADDEGPNSVGVIIPRIHDIVLGATVQIDNWNLEADPKDTEDILRKTRALSPAFNEVEVLQVKVGLRPGRSAIRLEVERFGDKVVVHNYGHGGAGYTLSWGCAKEVGDCIAALGS